MPCPSPFRSPHQDMGAQSDGPTPRAEAAAVLAAPTTGGGHGSSSIRRGTKVRYRRWRHRHRPRAALVVGSNCPPAAPLLASSSRPSSPSVVSVSSMERARMQLHPTGNQGEVQEVATPPRTQGGPCGGSNCPPAASLLAPSSRPSSPSVRIR